jgi:hypothetical protein
LKLSVLFHSNLRMFIFVSVLLLSTAIIGIFLCRIPNNLPMQIGAGFFTIVLELSMAYVLGKALAYGRDKQYWKSGILFLFWGTYVFIACIASIMLFMTELNQKEVIAEQEKQVSSINLDGYNSAVDDVNRYKRLMDLEEKTTPGSRWREYENKKIEAESKRNKYAAKLKTETNTGETPQDLNGAFAQVFPKAWKTLLVIIFGIVMLVVYVMQILTAWEIPIESEKKGETKNETKPELAQPSETLQKEPDKSLGNVIPFESKKTYPIYNYPPIPDLPPELTKPSEDIPYKNENKAEGGNIPSKADPEPVEEQAKGDLHTVKILSLFQPEDIPQMLEFVNRLYDGVDDSVIDDDGIELNGVKKVSLQMGVTHHKCLKFNGLLNRIGAVVTENGIPSRGLWPKRRIIEFIEENIKENGGRGEFEE